MKAIAFLLMLVATLGLNAPLVEDFASRAAAMLRAHDFYIARVLGEDAHLSDAAQMSGLPGNDVERATSELIGAGFLEPTSIEAHEVMKPPALAIEGMVQKRRIRRGAFADAW